MSGYHSETSRVRQIKCGLALFLRIYFHLVRHPSLNYPEQYFTSMMDTLLDSLNSNPPTLCYAFVPIASNMPEELMPASASRLSACDLLIGVVARMWPLGCFASPCPASYRTATCVHSPSPIPLLPSFPTVGFDLQCPAKSLSVYFNERQLAEDYTSSSSFSCLCSTFRRSSTVVESGQDATRNSAHQQQGWLPYYQL